MLPQIKYPKHGGAYLWHRNTNPKASARGPYYRNWFKNRFLLLHRHVNHLLVLCHVPAHLELLFLWEAPGRLSRWWLTNEAHDFDEWAEMVEHLGDLTHTVTVLGEDHHTCLHIALLILTHWNKQQKWYYTTPIYFTGFVRLFFATQILLNVSVELKSSHEHFQACYFLYCGLHSCFPLWATFRHDAFYYGLHSGMMLSTMGYIQAWCFLLWVIRYDAFYYGLLSDMMVSIMGYFQAWWFLLWATFRHDAFYWGFSGMMLLLWTTFRHDGFYYGLHSGMMVSIGGSQVWCFLLWTTFRHDGFYYGLLSGMMVSIMDYFQAWWFLLWTTIRHDGFYYRLHSGMMLSIGGYFQVWCFLLWTTYFQAWLFLLWTTFSHDCFYYGLLSVMIVSIMAYFQSWLFLLWTTFRHNGFYYGLFWGMFFTVNFFHANDFAGNYCYDKYNVSLY